MGGAGVVASPGAPFHAPGAALPRAVIGLLALAVLVTLTTWCCCGESAATGVAAVHGVSATEAAPDVQDQHPAAVTRVGHDCLDAAVGDGMPAEAGSARTLVPRGEDAAAGYPLDRPGGAPGVAAASAAGRGGADRPLPATSAPYALCVLRT